MSTSSPFASVSSTAPSSSAMPLFKQAFDFQNAVLEHKRDLAAKDIQLAAAAEITAKDIKDVELSEHVRSIGARSHKLKKHERKLMKALTNSATRAMQNPFVTGF